MARAKRQGKSASPNRRNGEDEGAVVQQILLLEGGELNNFDPAQPPAGVKRFLRQATLSELQGTLIEVLAAMRSARK